MLIILLFILNIVSKPYTLLESGYSFGNYNPRIKFKASLMDKPGKKLFKTTWSERISIGLGAYLYLKEEAKQKGMFFSTYYNIYKTVPFEHFISIDLGFVNSLEKLYYSSNYNIFYFVTNNLDFTSSVGISRTYNTNFEILFGTKFKI